MKYDQRVVAFIDVLGFRSIVDDTVDKDGKDIEKNIDFIVNAYKSIRDIWDLDKVDTNSVRRDITESKQASIFSDSIVISFKASDPSEVFYTLLEIKWLIIRLLSQNMICRGAVSLGKFIHTPEYLFGPALIEAYLLESKAAHYPRVILDSSVIDTAARYHAEQHTGADEKKYVESLLEQDSDGMYYIDYFYKAQEELDDPEYDFPKYVNHLGEIIRKGLMGSSHPSKAAIRIKYSWMREKFNTMVETVKHDNFAARMRKVGENKLANAYSKLKPISPNKFTKDLVRPK